MDLLLTLLLSVVATHTAPPRPSWLDAPRIDFPSAAGRMLSDGIAGPIDGLDGVGYGPCAPGVIMVGREIVFGVMYGDADSFETLVFPDPPISLDHFGRRVRTGEIVESDTVICVDREPRP